MSADPTELLRFLLAQQQQQQHGGGAQYSSKQQLQHLFQQLAPAAPALNAAQPPSLPEVLSRLVANYLQDVSRHGTNAPAPASNFDKNSMPHALATQGASHNLNMARQTNIGALSTNTSSFHENQRLRELAKLLATVNPGLAVAAVKQAMDSHQKQCPTPQQQNSSARASSETDVEVGVSTGSAPINGRENDEVLKNEVHCKSTKSKGVHEQDKGLLLAHRETQKATQPNESNGDAACPIGSLMDTVGTSRKSFPTSSPSSVPQSLGDVSLLTLQTWDLEQLESHVRNLQESNQPVPNAVRIVLDDVRKKLEKKDAKRMANRKFASTARARKKQLIDELSAAHAQLRRQALILSYLPDAVIVIGTDGEIKFCSTQLVRLLKYNEDDLVGLNIEELLVPDSRAEMGDLIREVVDAEERAISLQEQGRHQVEANGITSDEEEQRRANGSTDVDGGNISSSSQEYSNEANSVSQSSVKSIAMFKGHIEGEDDKMARKNLPISFDDPSSERNNTTKSNIFPATTPFLTTNPSSLAAEVSISEHNDKPSPKRAEISVAIDNVYSAKVAFLHGDAPPDDLDFKRNALSVMAVSDEYTSSNELNSCDTRSFNVDDVMGSSVTANNANAKLSSLMHVTRNKAMKEDGTKIKQLAVAQKQPSVQGKRDVLASCAVSSLLAKQGDSEESSVSSSTHVRTEELNSSEGSGYGDSYESSDDNERNSSSISGNFKTLKKEGKRLYPFAPAYNVRLIRSDLTTIWCELTSSIRTRTHNDEDSELGIIDHNPTASIIHHTEAPLIQEKEIILCCRPILEGGQVGEELLCPQLKRKAVHKEKTNRDVKSPPSGDIECTKGYPAKKPIYTRSEREFGTGESLEKKPKLSHGCTEDNLDP